MPWVELLLFLLALLEAPVTPQRQVDFAKDVRPIFEAKCQPCHFPGGKMYARLPFDQAATIVKLDEKVFTRIKDKESRAVIRQCLAQQKRG